MAERDVGNKNDSDGRSITSQMEDETFTSLRPRAYNTTETIDLDPSIFMLQDGAS